MCVPRCICCARGCTFLVSIFYWFFRLALFHAIVQYLCDREDSEIATDRVVALVSLWLTDFCPWAAGNELRSKSALWILVGLLAVAAAQAIAGVSETSARSLGYLVGLIVARSVNVFGLSVWRLWIAWMFVQLIVFDQ